MLGYRWAVLGVRGRGLLQHCLRRGDCVKSEKMRETTGREVEWVTSYVLCLVCLGPSSHTVLIAIDIEDNQGV